MSQEERIDVLQEELNRGEESVLYEARYYGYFEQLVELMTSLDVFDIPQIFAVMTELCKLLRVSKGVTSFYESPDDEARGEGERFTCYDSGEEHVLISHMRVITPGHIVVTCDVYQAMGADPLTPLERARVERIQRIMLTFMNKTREQKIIERLTLWDASGYRNLAYWTAETDRLIAAGEIGGKAALRVNLKHFSLVNDQVGRSNGDLVMRCYIRQMEDAFGEGGILCRMEGDNFVGLCQAERLPQITQLLKGQAVTYDTETGQRIEVSAVAGILMETDRSANAREILDKINAAYHAAKRRDKEDIVFYSQDLLEDREKYIRIQKLFDQALADREFLVYYQPKVDIQSQELTGAEALCRWLHNGALIPPMSFIPALEQGTDICRLDFYMLDRVCKDIRRWLDMGKNVVRVSVNLSRRHMMDPDLFDHIVSIIDSNNVPHEYIEIELTETTTEVEFQYLKRIVTELQAAGIQTSVDDFGVGYSSLNLIKEIPWNILKLDRSIMPSVGRNEERESRLFAHVIAMAHEIGLTCVAEGVETQEQLEIMRQFGCRIAQGFLFDMPLPPKEFERRMDKHEYQRAFWGRNTVWGVRQVESSFELISAASIAQALSADYFSIYCVDTETDVFIEYSASEAYQGLGLQTRGEDFFRVSRENIMRVIDPRDRDMLLAAFTKRKILASIRDGYAYTLTYRLLLEGGPTYVQMKAMRIDAFDEKRIVIGINNIDAEMKAQEDYQRMRDVGLTYSRIVQALAEDYFSIYYVNLNTGRFVEHSSYQNYDDLNIEKGGGNFFELSRSNARRVVYPPDLKAFLDTFQKEKLVSALDAGKAFTLTYRLMIRGKPTYVSMKATRIGDNDHIIIGVSNVDAQIRNRKALERVEEEQLTYNRITALSGDFIVIYTVDPETDHYAQYSAAGDFEGVRLKKEGEDFFADARQEGTRTIYYEDVEAFTSAFTKERVLDEIRDNGIFIRSFRFMMKGEPIYVRLKAALVEEKDGPQLIAGILNINAQVRREQDYEYKLAQARSKANIDALTGVKNKHAYVDAEEQLNRQIEAERAPKFAVVVCDVNDLKEINDERGHRVGDQILQDACAAICAVFDHSPVFRVGGDEFVVLAQKQDYENIDELMEKMQEINLAHRSEGGAVVACGMARYSGDRSVSAVFERADVRMYLNKRHLKS